MPTNQYLFVAISLDFIRGIINLLPSTAPVEYEGLYASLRQIESQFGPDGSLGQMEQPVLEHPMGVVMTPEHLQWLLALGRQNATGGPEPEPDNLELLADGNLDFTP